jgi:predicted DNA-binding antitoxin AbrB/MazE fold protein
MPDLTVVYESGILRPTTPIDFEEGQQLQIRVLDDLRSVEDHRAYTDAELDQALQPLVASGALTRPTKSTLPLPEMPLTAAPASAIESYGTGASPNPVSDIIIADRGSL